MVEQLGAPCFERGAGAVDAAEDVRDALQDGRADDGVADVESRDDVGDGPQPGGVLPEAVGDGRGLGDRGDGRGVGRQPLDLRVVAGEGVVASEEGDGAARGGVDVALGRRDEESIRSVSAYRISFSVTK